MLDKSTIIKVTNRDAGSVGYTVPDLRIERQYQKGETKEVTMEELRKLSYLPGGDYIIKNCLQIDNSDAVSELLGDVEPEYYYTEAEVRELLVGSGTLAQLQDCLDFAPAGVIDMIKDIAVKEEINDLSKRKAIYDKTGFNVDSAIMIKHETEEENAKEETSTRRAAPVKKSENTVPTRKTAPIQKYNVVK